MKTAGKKSGRAANGATKEMSFELKYCERCGGLWLRPVGGAQTYCVGCGRAMAELPPPSKEPVTARMCQGPEWGGDESDVEDWGQDEGPDSKAAGGAA